MKLIYILLSVFFSWSAQANQCDDCSTNTAMLLENIEFINTLHKGPTIDHAAEVESTIDDWAFRNKECIDFSVRKSCFNTCLEVVRKSNDLKYGKRNCKTACF